MPKQKKFDISSFMDEAAENVVPLNKEGRKERGSESNEPSAAKQPEMDFQEHKQAQKDANIESVSSHVAENYDSAAQTIQQPAQNPFAQVAPQQMMPGVAPSQIGGAYQQQNTPSNPNYMQSAEYPGMIPNGYYMGQGVMPNANYPMGSMQGQMSQMGMLQGQMVPPQNQMAMNPTVGNEAPKNQRGRKKSLRTIPRQNGKVVFLEVEADAALARISILQRVDKQDIIRTALDEFLANHYDGNDLDAYGSQLLTEYIKKTTQQI